MCPNRPHGGCCTFGDAGLGQLSTDRRLAFSRAGQARCGARGAAASHDILARGPLTGTVSRAVPATERSQQSPQADQAARDPGAQGSASAPRRPPVQEPLPSQGPDQPDETEMQDLLQGLLDGFRASWTASAQSRTWPLRRAALASEYREACGRCDEETIGGGPAPPSIDKDLLPGCAAFNARAGDKRLARAPEHVFHSTGRWDMIVGARGVPKGEPTGDTCHCSHACASNAGTWGSGGDHVGAGRTAHASVRRSGSWQALGCPGASLCKSTERSFGRASRNDHDECVPGFHPGLRSSPSYAMRLGRADERPRTEMDIADYLGEELESRGSSCCSWGMGDDRWPIGPEEHLQIPKSRGDHSTSRRIGDSRDTGGTGGVCHSDGGRGGRWAWPPGRWRGSTCAPSARSRCAPRPVRAVQDGLASCATREERHGSGRAAGLTLRTPPRRWERLSAVPGERSDGKGSQRSPPSPCKGAVEYVPPPWSEQCEPFESSASQRRALRSFLEQRCGSVARAYHEMTSDASLPRAGTAGRQLAMAPGHFCRALTALGYCAGPRDALFRSVDVDGDGFVSLQDMVDALVLDGALDSLAGVWEPRRCRRGQSPPPPPVPW